MANLINNKMKQAAGGNWGHPRKFVKKHTKIDIPDEESASKFPSKKKKKKAVKRWHFWDCPFCGEEVPERLIRPEGLHYVLWDREDHCKCGAYVVPECPACKHKTWFKDGVYKHMSHLGCGFTGKKLSR